MTRKNLFDIHRLHLYWQCHSFSSYLLSPINNNNIYNILLQMSANAADLLVYLWHTQIEMYSANH